MSLIANTSRLLFGANKSTVARPLGCALANHTRTYVTGPYPSQWEDYPRDDVVAAVGKTPLIKLRRASELTGCNIYGKAEFMNPGGSVKDRAALYLVKDAEERGQLKPGGTVVEGTAGNTGIGLAHICRAKGYHCVIYMPNTQSQEKIDTLTVLGAEVRPVPAVPFSDPNNYNHQAKRFAEGLENAIWTNQFDNTANRRSHYETTGPEIWAQLDGKIDAFTCSTGTGGTLAGVSQFMKEKNPDVKIVLADPPGSVLYNHFTHGKLEREGTGSVTEGIGQGRVTDNLNGAAVDWALHVPDEQSIEQVYHLMYEEGMILGSSAALNVAAATEVATKLGPGHTVVTILCDSGLRYARRLFNPEWLKAKKLWDSIPEQYHQFARMN
eukprot:Clim_evm39s225 gene=Clim_evmTU39s225